MSRLKNFLKQPLRRKSLVLEALVRLIWAWILVRRFSFRKYSERLGEARPGEFTTDQAPDPTLLRDVRWAVNAVNRTFRGRFTCLMQAMAGKAMLNRRHVPNTLVLGATLKRDFIDNEHENMAAHAWLRSGPVILLGGELRPKYLPVTSYHSA